jgi:hypothetical protein
MFIQMITETLKQTRPQEQLQVGETQALAAQRGLGAVATTEMMQQPALSAEQAQAGPEAVAEAFGKMRTVAMQINADPGFHVACEKQGIDPFEDAGKAAYWNIYAEYGQTRVRSIRERRQANGLTPNTLDLSALELMVTTPQYLYVQNRLNDTDYARSEASRPDRTVASAFNTQIQDFAKQYPQARAKDVWGGMLGTANIAFRTVQAREDAAKVTKSAIRGARHELATEAIVRATGREVHDVDAAQDLAGKDRIVVPKVPESQSGNVRRGVAYGIDVKASLEEVDTSQSGDTVSYRIKPDGNVVVYSLVSDHEFKGGFFLSPEQVQEKAIKTDKIFTEIERKLQQ